MDERDCDLRMPQSCVQWCQAQDYGLVVEDDIAPVDLDWWNVRLDTCDIPVRLWGIDANGGPIDSGQGFLRRRDLGSYDLPDGGRRDLTVLYRAAALLHQFSAEADVSAELVETWLAKNWRDRCAAAESGAVTER